MLVYQRVSPFKETSTYFYLLLGPLYASHPFDGSAKLPPEMARRGAAAGPHLPHTWPPRAGRTNLLEDCLSYSVGLQRTRWCPIIS